MTSPSLAFPTGRGAGMSRVLRESGPVHDALLIAWLATLAADRVDMAGGRAGFLLTPFLVLTPIVAASELLRRHARGRIITFERTALGFVATILALLGFVVASVFVSTETTVSASRAVLLCAQVIGTTVVVILARDREHFDGLLERGAVVGVLLFTLFDVLQVGTMLGAVPETAHLGVVTLDLLPATYGGIVPRLGGFVADQNRAGLLLVFFGWALASREGVPRRRGYLALIVLLALLTLSRSALTTAAAAIGMLVLERRVTLLSRRAILAMCLLAALITTTLLVSPQVRDAASRVLDPLVQRFSTEEGSTQVHFTLIGRGVETGTASIPRLALGLGYGSAYTVLQDVFPGNRYGSFHSLYVTMFAECGIFALLLVLVLVGTPLVRGGPYRPLVAGAAVFNLFYQATNDPVFWMILALAWLTMDPIAAAMRHSPAVTDG